MASPSPEPVSDCVVIPKDAAAQVRGALGLRSGTALRISYIAAFGDLRGTYRHWRDGRHDPAVPSMTYSVMFYELCARLGAEAQIVMRGRPGEGEAETIDSNFRFSRTEIVAPRSYFEFLSGMAANAWRCWRRVKAFRPHLIVVDGFFFWPFFRLLRATGAHVVLTLHSTCWPKGARRLPLKTRFENLLRRLGLGAVDAAICTSHEAARQLAKLSPRDLPIVVEVPQQVAQPQAEATPSGEPPERMIVYLGRIEREKGVLELVDAFAEICGRFPDARLVFAGRGGAEDELKAAMARALPNGGAMFLGHLDSDAVHALLAGAYCLVCPSQAALTEGLAFVCFEAAAHGVPSINCSVVPASDLLEGGCLVYDALDPGALAAAISRMLEDRGERRRLGAVARARSAVVFDRTQSWGTKLFEAILLALK